jgi:hypothetical protein
MVLWDHYSPLDNAASWQADTALFVMISGFTTSLQLRIPPRTTKNSNSPRELFNWKTFVLSRAVGIFPLLWFGLVLAIPYWIERPVMDKAACASLYVIGMQSWWRPACHVSGPNMLLYASIIWNVFLIYCVARWLLFKVQIYYAKKSPENEVIVQQASNNRLTGQLGVVFIFGQVCLVVGLLVMGNYLFLAKVKYILVMIERFNILTLFFFWSCCCLCDGIYNVSTKLVRAISGN